MTLLVTDEQREALHRIYREKVEALKHSKQLAETYAAYSGNGLAREHLEIRRQRVIMLGHEVDAMSIVLGLGISNDAA